MASGISRFGQPAIVPDASAASHAVNRGYGDTRYEAAGAVAAHAALSDPHPGYLTQTEGDARYQQPSVKPYPPVNLTDGATPALDASLGTHFRLSAAGNRTIAVPSSPTDGQVIVIEHLASGGARTLALNTGTGGFKFGTDITALSATGSGLIDYIQAVYRTSTNKWNVIGYVKGF